MQLKKSLFKPVLWLAALMLFALVHLPAGVKLLQSVLRNRVERLNPLEEVLFYFVLFFNQMSFLKLNIIQWH